jgi:protein SCO1/2
LELKLADQNNHQIGLDHFRGRPVLIAMFYSSCPFACPTLVSDLHRLEQKLSPELRDNLRVLLVSFDSEHDTPPVLKAVVESRHLDEARWTLAQASDDSVRQLAMVLGLKYRKLADGSFNHSSAITLLDAQGVVAGRIDGLSLPADTLLEKLRGLPRAAPPH